jgi:hypothetical protein
MIPADFAYQRQGLKSFSGATSRSKSELEAPARIELATLRLGNECSIQLSYGATIHLYKIHQLRYITSTRLACDNLIQVLHSTEHRPLPGRTGSNMRVLHLRDI